MKELEFKSFDITEHKADESGNLIITGYGAFFGNVDSHGDIIQQQAFETTIQMRGERIAFCYQHDIWNPIGKIKVLREDQKGLWLEVMLSAAEEDIQTKVKEGILKELSIGYRVVASRNEVRDGKEVRILERVDLFEISLVTIASNPLSVITGMKSEESKNYLESEYNRVLAIVRNENVKFELMKLKGLTLSVLAQKTEPPKEEKTLKADEILKLLNNN